MPSERVHILWLALQCLNIDAIFFMRSSLSLYYCQVGKKDKACYEKLFVNSAEKFICIHEFWRKTNFCARLFCFIIIFKMVCPGLRTIFLHIVVYFLVLLALSSKTWTNPLNRALKMRSNFSKYPLKVKYSSFKKSYYAPHSSIFTFISVSSTFMGKHLISFIICSRSRWLKSSEAASVQCPKNIRIDAAVERHR